MKIFLKEFTFNRDRDTYCVAFHFKSWCSSMYDGTKKASTESTEEFLAILTAYMDSNIVTKYFGLKTILFKWKGFFSRLILR